MNPVVSERLDEIIALCERHSVQRLAVFGSAVRDDFDPRRSDVDFLVDFQPMAPQEHTDAYFGLLADLESLLGRGIDLVESAALRNPYRRREIEATQIEVFRTQSEPPAEGWLQADSVAMRARWQPQRSDEAAARRPRTPSLDEDFWTEKSIEVLIAEQGIEAVSDPDHLRMDGVSDEEWAAFFEAMGAEP